LTSTQRRGSAIDFNVEPDPAFYVNADPDGRQANADSALEVEFVIYMKNIYEKGNGS
jgi:hypothetical protein